MGGRGDLVTRRTQFSSCDECRRSRVACDASSRRGELNDLSAPCTRCQNRNRPCTFKWMQDAKASASPAKRKGRRRQAPRTASQLPVSRDEKRVDHSVEPEPRSAADRVLHRVDWNGSCTVVQDNLTLTSGSPTPGSTAYDFASPPSYTSNTTIPTPAADLLGELDSQWIPALFKDLFEAVFGSWMGRYSNPFVFGQDSLADKYVSISELCSQLDRWMAESSNDGITNDISQQDSERDRQIQQSLQKTMAAFSSRWLPLTSSPIPAGSSYLHINQLLWRRARRDMLRVINRPSYRSMLSLFLFALTPIPNGISEEEEADGISGQSCVHAALQQIQTLRARQRNLQFNGSKVSPSTMKVQAICTTPESSIGTSSFINAESVAYWAALTFDTSASMTLNCRSMLSSGLFGFEAELPWRLVRTTSKMFDETAKQWSQGPFEMTDDRANQIIAAGASWKLLGWKLTAIFKEALRDGHNEPEVQKAFVAVVDSIKEFNTIYRPHLEICQRRMQFLSQKTKLRWYSLMLHYHLSILMFVDCIEVSNRYDLMAKFTEESADAETTMMNTLAFGLHNTFTLSSLSDSSDQPSPSTNSVSDPLISVPLVCIDPYSHHIVAGVALMRKAIDRDFGVGKITAESYQSLLSTLERTLSLLPQCSKSVQAARNKFSSKAPDEELPQHQDPYVVLQAQFAEWYGSH